MSLIPALYATADPGVSTPVIVLLVVVAAVVIFFVVRNVKGKEKAAEEEAYPQTTSVRTNIQSATPTSSKPEADKADE